MEAKDKAILDLAVGAGNLLLESGAEIFRVEETMLRISKYYGIEDSNPFVLSSGIFLTAENAEKQIYAKVKHIPLSGAHLDRVAAVNKLSREIEEGKFTVEEAKERLAKIAVMPGKRNVTKVLASGVGASSFCYLAGGDFEDCIVTFFAGFFLFLFLIWIEKRKKKTSKIVVNIMGGFVATFLSILFYQLGVGHNLNYMVIGAILPLLPGVAFTNAIRDLANGDYIAGSVRMLDALLVTFGVALGVGVVYSFYHNVLGGMRL